MRASVWIAVVLCGARAAAAQGIQLDARSIVNAAGSVAPDYPNGGIAHGGMFIVKAAPGSAPLGACGVKVADRFPIAANMNGTSMKIAMGGSSFDVPMIYVVACSGTDQLAGIVPSAVPPGAGTLSVSYGGQTGSAPIVVVDRTLGFFTINQGGTGAVIVQNYNSATDLAINTLATPAKPGQVEIAWGTGLGPDGHSDVDAPQPTDIPLDFALYVGGKQATVTYKGRSGCCAGIDQVAFQVPDGLDGCFVPVVARIGTAVSNFTTMAISADGRPCSDAGGLTAADIQNAQANGRIRLGTVDLMRADIEIVTGAASGSITRYDQAGAVFADLAYTDLLGMPVREISTPGSCTVWRGPADAVLDRPPLLAPHINLDAGAIAIRGAAGSVSMNFAANAYFRMLATAASSEPASAGVGPSPGFFEPGTFTVSSAGGGPLPGGKSIDAWSAPVAFPAPPSFDNRFTVAEVQRAQGVTVKWSGVDPAALVEIRGVAAPEDPAAPAVSFYCVEKASAGQFAIPAYVLLSLPAGSIHAAADSSALGLSVGVTAATRFPAPGLDAGFVRAHSLIGRGVTFQ